MANTLATKKQAAAIKQRMQEIRTQLPYDVDVARQSARQLSDWKYHMGRYPWALIGAAAVAGYLLVPRRNQSEVKVIHHGYESRDDEQLGRTAAPRPAKRGMIGGIGGAIATMAMKQAASMIAQQVSQRFSPPAGK